MELLLRAGDGLHIYVSLQFLSVCARSLPMCRRTMAGQWPPIGTAGAPMLAAVATSIHIFLQARDAGCIGQCIAST
jgi:hypothetical protein